MDQERISALVEKYWDKVKEHRYYMHTLTTLFLMSATPPSMSRC